MEKKIFLKKNDALFYIAYGLYFITRYAECTTLSGTSIGRVLSLCKNFSYVLCVLIIVLKLKYQAKTTIKKMVICCILLALIAYQVVMNDGKSIFVVLLFGFAFMGRDLRCFLRINYWLHLGCFSSTILLMIVGLTENVITSQEKFGTMWTRMALGFNYPGQLMMSLMPIVFLYYYLAIDKISMYKNLFWISIVAFFYLFSQTIMPTLMCLGFIFAVNIVKQIATWKWVYLIVPFSAVITYVLWYLFTQDFSVAILIDRISNYRFSLGTYVLEKYDITLWGTGFQNINNSKKYWVLDSEYIFMVVSNGIIYTTAAIYMFTVATKWANKKGDIMMVWVFGVLAVNAIFNNGIFNLLMNPFIIVMAEALGNEGIKHKRSLRIILRTVFSLKNKGSITKIMR